MMSDATSRNTLAFRVREVRQHSPVCHLVSYSAEMELLDRPEPTSVEMLSVCPPDADPSDVEVGRQMVKRGAVRALIGTGRSARIRVSDFVIHPTDFYPKRVEEFTFRAVRDALTTSNT